MLARSAGVPCLGWQCMNFRYLGKSGFKISEITYGNWLTHGSQVENDQATGLRTRGTGVLASALSTLPTSTPTPRPRPCSGDGAQG